MAILGFLVVLFFQCSSATLFSFTNGCDKLETTNHLLNSSSCKALTEDPDKKILTHLNLLHMTYDLKFPELILIISDNMANGDSLARYLTKGNTKKRNKNRQDIPNEQLPVFDFILNNIHMYEYPEIPPIFVYPQQTDEQLASIFAYEIVKATSNIKIILTSSLSKTENGVARIFNTAAKFLRNSKRYRESIRFVATNEKGVSKNEVTKIWEGEIEGIIEDYIRSSKTSGRQLAKFVIGDIRILDGFTAKNYQNFVSYLNGLKQTRVDRQDFENIQILYTDCVFNFANHKMSSLVKSIKSSMSSHLSEESKSTSTLTGVLTMSEKLNLINRSLLEFFTCTINLDIETLGECFKKLNKIKESGFEFDEIISKSEMYLSLFCYVYQASSIILPEVEYVINPEEWTSELKNYETSLRGTTKWYNELVSIFQNVHQMTKENISQTLVDLSNELDDKIFELDQAKMAHETIKANAIKMEATSTFLRVENEIKLQVTGKFLRLSHILNDTDYPKRIKILEIFALEKIIIDRDLKANPNGLDVIIFAPIWEIVLERSINLDGVSENQIKDILEPKAKNGNTISNRNGANGQAGLSGGAGGTFFGLADKIINAKNLKISLNGGNGSNGQNGGDAANGEDGETPSPHFLIENLNRHHCKWPRNNPFIYRIEKPERDHYYIPLIGPMIRLKYKQECYIFGLEGYPGGHGGHGGVKGKGGIAGTYKLLSLDNSTKFSMIPSAVNGSDGIGGSGGTGGIGGFTRKVTFHNKDYFDYSIKENVTDVSAPDGEEGIPNASFLGKQINKERTILQTLGQTINLYKRYILSEIANGGSEYIKIYKQLIVNPQILENYDSITLVDEFMDLEQHYYKIRNKSETLFLYQSWKNRLDHYSANRKQIEKTKEYSEVLRSLETIVSSKIGRLVKNSQSFMIFMLAEYLVESQQQVRHLQNAKTVVVIKNTNRKYTEEYDDKIEEAQRIIQEDLQSNLTRYNDELSGEMEMLLRRISRQVEMEKWNTEALIKKSVSMQEKVMIKTFNDIFSIVIAGLGIINPALATIGTKISAAGSILQNFMDETADKNIEVIIPNIVDKSRKFYDNWLDANKEFEKWAIDQNLETLRSKKKELSSRNKNIEPLESIERSFQELRNERKPLGNVIETLSDKIESEVNIWQHVNTKAKKIYSESLKVLKHLKTVTRVRQMLGDLVTKCSDLQNPKNIDGISNEIEKAFERTRRMRNFKEEVIVKMIPLLEKIRDTTNIHNLHNSVTFLDFKNFQMQQYFENIFKHIENFAKEFKMESHFEKTLNKMQSVMQMVLSTYSRIEEYVETMKKADYEKDLYLAPFDITYVKDPKLSMSLAKMVQKTYANIVLDDYSKWISSFKQYIFPFADEFMGVYESSIPEVDDLLINAQDAGDHLELFGSKINKKRAELHEFENTVTTKFGYSLPPFHVWKKDQYSNEINSLLSGEKIQFYANITEHQNLNAVKFSDIWLRFGTSDSQILSEMKNDLQGFAVILEHNGDSHYRCDERIFLISSKSHRREKVFMDDTTTFFDVHFPLKIMAVEKIKSDYILSPFATWTFQIMNQNSEMNFEKLEKYKSKVDLELVGLGQYSDKNLNVCRTDLGKYYNNEL